MSRIIVKNLPSYIDEARLKEHFSKRYKLTDVKLMKTRDGRTRRFCFIGFSTSHDGEDAVKYYNDSFIDTSQIRVELAKTLNDSTLITKQERLKRKAEAVEIERQKRHKQEEKKKLKKDHGKIEIPDNPKLQEFLQVMGTSASSKAWANDDGLETSGPEIVNDSVIGSNTVVSKTIEHPTGLKVPEQCSDDEYEDVPGKLVTLNNEVAVEDSEKEKMVRLDEIPSNSGENNGDSTISDMDWLQMKRRRMTAAEEEKVLEQQDAQKSTLSRSDSLDSKSHHQVGNAMASEDQTLSDNMHDQDEDQILESDINNVKQQILASKRLFLRNLSYSSSEDDFENLFAKYGILEEVHIPVDAKSGKSKGFAYIQFSQAEDAVTAYEALDKCIFHGRLLHILPGKPKKEKKLDEFDIKNLPLRKQQAMRRKVEAVSQSFSWNSLYISSDAVMESVAKKLGVNKSDLINPDSTDSAVKQALAETSVLADIRQYFESQGIDLSSFGNVHKKDDRVILVKNLPFGTMIDEITEMFGPYGEITRVLIPPDGTICMIIYKNIPDGRAAFAKLAYRRFKKSILYLEKGPKGLFESVLNNNSTLSLSQESVNNNNNSSVNTVKAKPTAADVLDINKSSQAVDEEDLVDLSQRASLYIKNLNFRTTSTELFGAFKALEGVASARVQTKPDIHNSGQTKSLGFGFVEFNSKQQAMTAMKVMQGHVLHGHELQIQMAQRGRDEDAKQAKGMNKKGTQTKIIIKNVPFEATKSDIQKLFGTFGQLKSVRLPKKFDKSARGFAFAEFVTSKEAENAVKALQGTHLLGRRLVIQYAEAEALDAQEEIERMEAKVRKQVTKETLQGMRLSGKRRVELEDEGRDEE